MTEQPKANLFEISPCNCLLVSVSLAVFLVVARLPAAVPDPGGGGPPTAHPWLDSWSFSDTNTWKSDLGFSPIGFTNLTTSLLRTEANALVVDSVNPSWLRFNVREGSGATNLNVAGSGGSALFWFSPNWCSANSTNEAGSGPGVMGRVLEVGSSASNGWFSLYFDAAGNNLYFVTQTNTGSAATNFAAPISFTSNSWHLIVWNWSVTNSALFIDGTLATNGSGTTLLPGPSVLSNGFRIGSDSTGVLQMHGAMSDLTTYSYPLDAATISSTYMLYSIFYLNPDDININVTFYPTFNAGAYNVVGGPGALTIVGTNTTTCAPTNSNIWITNTTVTVTNGTNFLLFSVAGGVPGVAYDVFATGGFLAPTNNTPWAWLGQATNVSRTKLALPMPRYIWSWARHKILMVTALRMRLNI